MNLQHKWEFFGFWTLDHKAAQAHLNRRADEGWALTGLPLGLLARYERTEPGAYRYFADWYDPLNEDPGYLELCADAGWEELCAASYVRLFRSRSRENPALIHTDSTFEYDKFFKKVLKRKILGSIGLILLLVFYFVLCIARNISPGRLLLGMCRQGFLGAVVAFVLPAAAAGFLIYLICLLHGLLRWRGAIKQGKPLPTPGRAGVTFRRLISLLGVLVLVMIALCFLLDVCLYSPRAYLPVLIGLTIGGAGSMLLRTKITARTRRRGLTALAVMWVLVIFCAILHGSCPTLLQPLVVQGSPPPMLETESLWTNTQVGPLVRFDSWYEDLGYSRQPFHPQDPGIFHCARTITRGDFLTDLALTELWDGRTAPFPEEARNRDGVWEWSEEHSHGLLLRSGNAVMLIALNINAPCEPQALADMAWAFLTGEGTA